MFFTNASPSPMAPIPYRNNVIRRNKQEWINKNKYIYKQAFQTNVFRLLRNEKDNKETSNKKSNWNDYQEIRKSW